MEYGGNVMASLRWRFSENIRQKISLATLFGESSWRIPNVWAWRPLRWEDRSVSPWPTSTVDYRWKPCMVDEAAQELCIFKYYKCMYELYVWCSYVRSMTFVKKICEWIIKVCGFKIRISSRFNKIFWSVYLKLHSKEENERWKMGVFYKLHESYSISSISISKSM